SVPCSPAPGGGTSAVTVAGRLEALSANATYHFRVVATSSGGTPQGSDPTFATLPNPPLVETGAAAAITQSEASLNASVNANGAALSDCHFDYGTSPSYGASMPCSSLPKGAQTSAETAFLASLGANTAYHYRIVATNPGGTSVGADRSFTTLPQPPEATTEQASGMTQTSATLNGTVDPMGATIAECRFEYGTSSSYG